MVTRDGVAARLLERLELSSDVVLAVTRSDGRFSVVWSTPDGSAMFADANLTFALDEVRRVVEGEDV